MGKRYGNGGIKKLIKTSDKEREILSDLEGMDRIIQGMRKKLRYGEVLSGDDLKKENKYA